MQARWKEKIEVELNNFLPLSSNVVQPSLTSISMSVMFYCIHKSYGCIHNHYIGDFFLRKKSQNWTLSVSKSSHTHTGCIKCPLVLRWLCQKYIGMMTALINDQLDYDESSHSNWCVQIGQLWHFIPRKTWRCSQRYPKERHMPRQTNSYPSRIVGNCLHGMSIITGCNCNVGNVF